LKRILCYIIRMLEYDLRYKQRTETARLLGYCDSHLDDYIDTRKSTTIATFFLDNCFVSWQPLMQWAVAFSSCEAECIAATTATTQAIWMAWLLGELLGREPEVVTLALARNTIFHERNKHINLRCHFIQNCLAEGSASATYINTGDQLADVLIKALG
jgi:hypothetical protein